MGLVQLKVRLLEIETDFLCKATCREKETVLYDNTSDRI